MLVRISVVEYERAAGKTPETFEMGVWFYVKDAIIEWKNIIVECFRRRTPQMA